MKTTRLILVGGFLGAGKTNLLWETARQIKNQGLRVGLITNDQAPELVDTVFLSKNKTSVVEVSGSCFCCNFNGLIDALQKVKSEVDADIIIAEPVGSCTDLSATIIQPLRANLGNDLIISPLTILADPHRLTDILDGGDAGLHPNAAYIFRKQLEESDIILISKSDLISNDELSELQERVIAQYPESDVMTASSKTGDGINRWLNVVQKSTNSGKKLIDIDYDVYAKGEAVLGWLNGSLLLKGNTTDWNMFASNFLLDLSLQFDNMNAAVGHVKMIIESEGEFMMGNITGRSQTISTQGTAGTGEQAQITINARVEMKPEKLNQIIQETLERNTFDEFDIEIIAWKFLSPGRPEPTYRYKYVVPTKTTN